MGYLPPINNPSNVILQWGKHSMPTVNEWTQTLPIAVTSKLNVFLSYYIDKSSSFYDAGYVKTVYGTQFVAWTYYKNNNYFSNIYWFAIGF